MMPSENYDAQALGLRRMFGKIEAAAREGRRSIAQILTEQRIDVDSVLRLAVMNCDVGMVAFLLQKRWTGVFLTESTLALERAAMVKFCVRGFGGARGTYSYKCVQMARLLVQAGADVSCKVPIATPNMVVLCEDSCLDTIVKLKAGKSGENLRKLEFFHHVLLRGEGGVHGASWLWPAESAAPVGPVAPFAPFAPVVPASPAPRKMAVRCARGPAASSRVVLGGLFRYSEKN